MSTQTTHQTTNCLIFAHRGLHMDVMENTQAAFDKALEYAIDGIETDVQLTRDEITVLWHDRFLDKIGLTNKRIDDLNYDQLEFLMSLTHEPNGENIMGLQAFLDAYRERTRLLIEVKNREGESVSHHEIKIRQTLNRVGAVRDQRIIVSSFNLASLVYAHRYKAEFPLIHNFKKDQTVADAQHVLTVNPFLHGLCLPIETLDQAMVDLLRDHGKCIAVYTCNSDEEVNKAFEFDVDILISDDPQRAIAIRGT